MPRPAPDRGIRRPERLRLTWTLVLGVLLAGPQSARADGALLGGPLAVDRTDVATGPAPAPSPARRRIGSEALVSVPEAIDGGPRLPAGVASLPHQELELADVGEVYATGEPLIEWQDPQDLTDYGDLWDRIRNGFAMAEIDSPLVQRHEAWYLNRPEYVERMVARSRRYLFHIVEELEKRGMPMEIALLPMIESAYNPVAQSHMSAVGMWQFIPSTGKEYGLQQNWWYDARRDVLAATQAALDYLQYLHQRFGDWELALAAYNWGEGAVSRAITNNRKAKRPTDYMNLKMPKETRNYLPKLQAVKNIVSDPVVLGMALEPIPDRPYFAVVKVPAHIDVAMAAKLADVPLEEFRYLNPGHNRPVITVANRQLLLPVDKVDIFNANLQSNDQPLVTWQTYQLKDDDTLESVARKFDIDLSRLREVNGLGGNRGTRPGQMLLVPMEDDADTNLDETYDSPEFRAPLADHTQRMIYRVKRGDTLSSIARRHGVSIASLKAWNGLRNDRVQAGQRLNVQEPARASAGSSKAGAKRSSKQTHAGGKPQQRTANN
ncbi:MAG: transglycosylase SLT domain-containing protein [Burkholderiales bacterium]|nr:transglycosylase SLT domain-containing protein [Burkholderiales bacterium]